jgi:hypothetical protein
VPWSPAAQAGGVEDETTWAALAASDVELIQGYVIARPLPPVELEKFIAAEVDRRTFAGRPIGKHPAAIELS